MHAETEGNRSMQKMSLRQFAYRYAGLLLVAMILLLGINLWVIHRHTDAATLSQSQYTLNQHANHLGQQLEFYRDVLKRLAQQSRVRDLLVMDDAAAAQDWAISQRDYLPNSIGMALIGAGKLVMGTPVELHLGPACIRDMDMKLANKQSLEPLVHRDNPALAHFDLTEPVESELHEVLGVLFVSFSLDSLQTALANSVQAGDTLILRDGLGQVIVQAGTTSNTVPTIHLATPIPGSGWRLELTHPKEDNMAIYLALGGTNGFTVLLVIAVFVALTNALVRIFVRELTGVQTMLSKINEGEVPVMPPSVLKEIQKIVPVIQAIAHNIHEKQTKLTEMSVLDELTQLPNRRSFNTELARACHLAQRGVGVYLLLLDVDYFKQVNDTAGHEAGDRMLQILAACLRHDTRQTDFSARLGGDEFAVIFTNMKPESLKPWMDNLAIDFATAQQTDPITARVARCTLSAGAATSICGTHSSPVELLRRADQALYQAKDRGRNRLEVDHSTGLEVVPQATASK